MGCWNRIGAIAFVIGMALSSVRAQSPFLFAGTTIDAINSGDCKALGDIDLDGKADPILGGSSLAWYESGAGFARHVIRSQVVYKEFTTDAQAADMDWDGDFDIILGDGAGFDNLIWFENPLHGAQPGNPRNGSEWEVRIIGSHGDTVHDVEVADLDQDQRRDVLSSGHGFTHIWKHTAAGTWLTKDLSALAGDGVFIGDINRDGNPDIATPHAWLENPGDIIAGDWVRHTIDGAGEGDECLLVDLNKDGRLDLVTCSAHDRGPLYWFEQPPDPTSPAWTRRTIDPAMGAHHPESGDFDRDGRPDLLMGLELAEIAIYLNPGGDPPEFVKQTVALSGGHNARRGDMNGDGKPDVFACDYIGNPPARVYINQWCYPNCDGSLGTPALTVNDLVCFLGAFASGATYANCDASPMLNILDFQCFLGKFLEGCP